MPSVRVSTFRWFMIAKKSRQVFISPKLVKEAGDQSLPSEECQKRVQNPDGIGVSSVSIDIMDIIR